MLLPEPVRAEVIGRDSFKLCPGYIFRFTLSFSSCSAYSLHYLASTYLVLDLDSIYLVLDLASIYLVLDLASIYLVLALASILVLEQPLFSSSCSASCLMFLFNLFSSWFRPCLDWLMPHIPSVIKSKKRKKSPRFVGALSAKHK